MAEEEKKLESAEEEKQTKSISRFIPKVLVDLYKRKEIIPESLPKVLVDLYKYKCKHEFDANTGSITFYPTPNCVAASTKLDTTAFTESYTFSNLLKSVKCSKLEGINKEMDAIIASRSGICSFVSCASIAWQYHYPFRFKPDHIWLLILQTVAKHVEKNAEKLRKKYVSFSGKKELVVYRDWAKGNINNDWGGVIAEFAQQIDKNTISDTVALLENNFTSATLSDSIAVKVTIMDVCKSFFRYKCVLGCGFPQITLDGNRNDWILLKQKAEKLLQSKVDKKLGKKWGKALLPILDKFIDTFNGKIDCLFWNSMIKRGGKPIGSGGQTSEWFTGWINILFPYINERENPFCEPYQMDLGYVKQGLSVNMLRRQGWQCEENKFGHGVDVDEYPVGIASAPVLLVANGKQYNLKFVSGFMGYKQDAKTLEITPNVSWFIGEE